MVLLKLVIVATAFRAASSEQATALTTCQGALSKYTGISTECGYPSAYTCSASACIANAASASDTMVADMITGFATCTGAYASYGSLFTAETLTLSFLSTFNACGLTSALTPPALTTCLGALSKYSRISGECGYSGFVQQAGDCQQGTELVCLKFYGQDANTAFGCPDGFTLRDSVQPQVQGADTSKRDCFREISATFAEAQCTAIGQMGYIWSCGGGGGGPPPPAAATLENQICSSSWTNCEGCSSNGDYCGTPSGARGQDMPLSTDCAVSNCVVVCGVDNCPTRCSAGACIANAASASDTMVADMITGFATCTGDYASLGSLFTADGLTLLLCHAVSHQY